MGISQLRTFLAVLTISSLSLAQAPETETHDTAVTFESKVNLVPVPVIVRDKKSVAIGDLTKDDFQVFDNGKLQVITKFSVEKAGAAYRAAESKPIPTDTGEASLPATLIANRFVAYVFDDLHFGIQDLMQARIAALKHFEAGETADTRAAVYTTSGISPEDFTSDREKLKAALMRLSPRSRAPNPETDCPYLGYYAADLIANKNDSLAMQAAVSQIGSCPMPPGSAIAAQAEVRSAAFRAIAIGEDETRRTLAVLQSMVKRIAAMPGERTLVLVSPGFIFPTQEQDVSKLIDLAIRMKVVINSIDGRGLYVDSRYDASRSQPTNVALAEYQSDEASQDKDTLATMAEGTGGTAFANNNDLLAGFRLTASQPEFTYVLGFSPQSLKNDGKFHSIKVKLKEKSGFSVQARRGYFAPTRTENASDQAKQDVEDALFSREELTDFPLSLNTQFFKSSDTSAKLSIIARVGIKGFHFRKGDGRNNDQLTVVAALFDRDGNYISGRQTIVDLRFRDETLARHRDNGLAIKASFDDVKPGGYVLRLVARDSEGKMISATNGSIEVP